MTLTQPGWLALLLAVAALAVWFILTLRQRQQYALRLSSAQMFGTIAPRRPTWKRVVPAVLFLLALTVGSIGTARPAQVKQVTRQSVTVVVAMDISRSMLATDVPPDRLSAAKKAAVDFVQKMPQSADVGLVSFETYATVRSSPTEKHAKVVGAIERLEVGSATAIGDAIFASLDSIETDGAVSDDGRPAAAIILLSDGDSTEGRPVDAAIAAAKKAQIPVSTISFGTPDGMIETDDPTTPQNDPKPYAVPVQEDNLKQIAEGTGGKFYSANSLESLNDAYAELASTVSTEKELVDITYQFLLGAMALLLVSGALSMLWMRRLP